MGRPPNRHDVFISYSHRDGEVAQALQYELERFTKPWWRPRALRVFRDQTNLTAAPDLWQSVVDALGRSDWFILMASPEAAGSAWVPREVEWWRTNRPVDRMLLGLTGGEIAWDADDFDWGRTTALPHAIAGTFPREPLWVDLRGLGDPPRVGDLVAEFAAPIMGRPKDELIGLHIRQHRRTRRLAGMVIAALSALLLLTSVAAVVAVRQRAAALTEARISLSRQLAATATTLRDTDLDLAQLLAVQAYRTDPNEQTRTALFGAVTASPHLVRFLPTGANVVALTASGDGAGVIAGLADGTVMRWSAENGRGEAIGRLPRPVRAVAADRTARTVLASDGTSVLIWTSAGARVATAGTAVPVIAVALSPSGRHAALVTSSYSELAGDGGSRYDITVRDLVANGPARSLVLGWAPRSVAFPSDSRIVVAGLAGQLERLRLPSLTAEVHTAEGDPTPIGAHGFQPTLSGNGTWLTYTNGGGYLPIYPTTQWYGDRPTRYGAGHGNHEQALAISNDGRMVAAADAGTIYLSDTAAEVVPPAHAVLTGGGAVPEGGLVFLGGTGTRLASASGRHVAIWDTRQVSRIATRNRITLEAGAFGSPPPQVTLSPSGRSVAVQPADWGDLLIHNLADDSTLGANGQFLGWGADDDHFFLLANDGRLTERLAASPARVTRTVAVYPKDSNERPFAVSPDGLTTSFLLDNGAMQIRDAASGRVIGTIHGPAAASGVGVFQDPTGTLAAAILQIPGAETSPVAVYDLHAGTAHLVGAGRLHAVTVTRTGLLVQRSNGDLEWWNQAGTRLRKVVHQDRSLVPTEVTQASDPALGEYLVAQRRSDGNLVVTDLRTGDVLGALELPGAALDVKVGMTFTAGDRQLISATEGGDDGQLLRWDLTPDGWISAACASAGRTLTTVEWTRLVATPPPEDLDCLKA